jgi:hypothetical protein
LCYLPLTDGNQRVTGGLTYKERLINIPGFDLTGRAEAYTSNNTLGGVAPYFNPSRDLSVTGGLLAAPLAGGRPARGGHANLGLTAAQFLNHAAAAAARQPALHVRDDQYMYIASEERWASTFATAGGGDGPAPRGK